MSIRCEGCGLEYAGGRGLKGILAQRSRVLDPRFVRMLLQVRRFHRRALDFLRTSPEDDLTTYGEFLATEGFSEPLPHPLRRARRVLRLVRRRGDRPAVPRALPVPVPGPPRHAAGDRLAAVVHRRRRVPHLRGADRRAAARGPPRAPGHRRHPPRRRRRRARRLRRGHPRRPRRHRHPRRPGARPADRPDRRRGHDAEVVRLLPQRDRAAHGRVDPAGRPRGAGLLELPHGLVRQPERQHRRHLLDEPAAGARLARAAPRHAQRTRADRPGDGARRDAVRAPDLHPRGGGRPGAAGAAWPPTAPCTPAPTTAGASTRTAAARAWRRHARSERPGEHAGSPDHRDAAPAAGTRRGPRRPHAEGRAAQRLPARRLPVAGRPGRAAGAAVVPAPLHRLPRRRPPRRPAPQHQGQPARLRRPAQGSRWATKAASSCWPTPASPGTSSTR